MGPNELTTLTIETSKIMGQSKQAEKVFSVIKLYKQQQDSRYTERSRLSKSPFKAKFTQITCTLEDGVGLPWWRSG